MRLDLLVEPAVENLLEAIDGLHLSPRTGVLASLLALSSFLDTVRVLPKKAFLCSLPSSLPLLLLLCNSSSSSLQFLLLLCNSSSSFLHRTLISLFQPSSRLMIPGPPAMSVFVRLPASGNPQGRLAKCQLVLKLNTLEWAEEEGEGGELQDSFSTCKWTGNVVRMLARQCECRHTRTRRHGGAPRVLQASKGRGAARKGVRPVMID